MFTVQQVLRPSKVFSKFKLLYAFHGNERVFSTHILAYHNILIIEVVELEGKKFAYFLFTMYNSQVHYQFIHLFL